MAVTPIRTWKQNINLLVPFGAYLTLTALLGLLTMYFVFRMLVASREAALNARSAMKEQQGRLVAEKLAQQNAKLIEKEREARKKAEATVSSLQGQLKQEQKKRTVAELTAEVAQLSQAAAENDAKNEIWQIISLTNHSPVSISFSILKTDGTWRGESLQPQHSSTYWETGRKLIIRFAESDADGAETMRVTAETKTVIGHRPTQDEISRATHCSFEVKFYDENDNPWVYLSCDR
jgi:hypothetical protein